MTNLNTNYSVSKLNRFITLRFYIITLSHSSFLRYITFYYSNALNSKLSASKPFALTFTFLSRKYFYPNAILSYTFFL